MYFHVDNRARLVHLSVFTQRPSLREAKDNEQGKNQRKPYGVSGSPSSG
jgi:hypothetical protein